MSYCYEKIITISPKLATLASGQILTHFLMIHRYTHTHTHTQTQEVPIYMEDFILPCNNNNHNNNNTRFILHGLARKLYRLKPKLIEGLSIVGIVGFYY